MLCGAKGRWALVLIQFVCVLFFFQAEDGIRDRNVTGVQTCALPISYFFEKMGWGKLELVKEKKKLLTFTLLADSVVHRLKAPIETEFRLEAGFLSESIQLIHDIECECIEEINPKIHQVQFKIMYTAK